MSIPPVEYKKLSPDGQFRIHASGQTDVGREREVNEDSIFLDSELELFVVCDGMGGHTGGKMASQMAVDAIVQSVQARSNQDSDGDEQIDKLVLGQEVANQTIYQHAIDHPELHGMGTTAVGMWIDTDKAQISHVGDSRLYRLRGTNLQQLTRDHSLSNLYADHPELQGRMGPATSNVIVRAIGLEPKVRVDHTSVVLQDHDLFLLCCDGLSDLVEDEKISEILQRSSSLATRTSDLIHEANLRGGTDNISVILVRVNLASNDFEDSGKTSLGF